MLTISFAEVRDIHALRHSSAQGQASVADLPLQANAGDSARVGSRSDTLLHWALLKARGRDIVEPVLHAKSDMNIENEEGLSALHLSHCWLHSIDHQMRTLFDQHRGQPTV